MHRTSNKYQATELPQLSATFARHRRWKNLFRRLNFYLNLYLKYWEDRLDNGESTIGIRMESSKVIQATRPSLFYRFVRRICHTHTTSNSPSTTRYMNIDARMKPGSELNQSASAFGNEERMEPRIGMVRARRNASSSQRNSSQENASLTPMQIKDIPDDSPKAKLQKENKRYFKEGSSYIMPTVVAFLCFVFICSAGFAIVHVLQKAEEKEFTLEAQELAEETGQWVSSQLDKALLPLFSMSQFAVELEQFQDLPKYIGPAHDGSSAPLIPGDSRAYRNITGICDETTLIRRFADIASTLKARSDMQGVLVNLQLAPQGVVCLVNPLNNTEDFGDGMFLDSTAAWGLDLFEDPLMSFIARKSITETELSIAGPRALIQCPACGDFFIARLPIEYEDYEIFMDGVPYKRWGFATAIINWDELVKRGELEELFASHNMGFQLTRTDYNYVEETDSYETTVAVLAESGFSPDSSHLVETALETTNNEWRMTVSYERSVKSKRLHAGMPVCFALSALISALVFVVLKQRQDQLFMKEQQMAQYARVTTEKNMTAYFAHELRNPLGAIESALYAIPDDAPANIRELVTEMRLCTAFMSSMMNNLLDFRRLGESQIMFDLAPCSVKALVDEVYSMLKTYVQPGVDLKVECSLTSSQWVICDKHRVQQILTNLLMNAIKYTTEGTITLSVSWEASFLHFVCEDTGTGVAKGEQDRLFEHFSQKGETPGTRLGLAIAKQLVQLMNGSLSFESDPSVKRGSCCSVLLPLPPCKPPAIAGPATGRTQPAKPKALLQPLRILIVDDIKINRAMLSRRLKKGVAPNSSITEACTGEEALEICETQKFDIYVLDNYMEESGGKLLGIEVVKLLRDRGVLGIIIGCSANELDEEFKEAGADWTWQKPIPDNATMIQQIQEALLPIHQSLPGVDEVQDGNVSV